jgi:hypothetical protein
LTLNWCRYHLSVWDSETGERMTLQDAIDREGDRLSLPVADCPDPHGYTDSTRIAVANCPVCRRQLALVQLPDGTHCLPPHEGEAGVCEASNEPSAIHMMRDAEAFAQEQEG